jgi:hypothetical protein
MEKESNCQHNRGALYAAQEAAQIAEGWAETLEDRLAKLKEKYQEIQEDLDLEKNYCNMQATKLAKAKATELVLRKQVRHLKKKLAKTRHEPYTEPLVTKSVFYTCNTCWKPKQGDLCPNCDEKCDRTCDLADCKRCYQDYFGKGTWGF